MPDTSQTPTGREGPTGDEEPESGPTEAVPPAVLTFLIADVRGYTRFTQEHGDEEAGRLAGRFAELTRDAVVAGGGELIELRGDEALCVFKSARQAVRAAVELQARFRRVPDEGSAFPLPIGVGLDAGEAVPIEGGYRGGALNTAARLCSVAAPGQILATDTVVNLSGRLEGVKFLPRRAVRLKGLERPVRLIEIVPERPLPPVPQVLTQKRARITTRRVAVGGLAGIALVAAALILALVYLGGSSGLTALDADALGAIDDGGGIASQVKLDSAPSAISSGGGFVWAVSETEGTLTRFDPGSEAIRSLAVGGRPGGVAYGAGSVWVTKGADRKLVQINPKTFTAVQTIPVGNAPGALAVGAGAVWVVNGVDGTVSRFDLQRGSITDTIPVGPNPSGIAVGAGAVWVASEDSGTVIRIDPASRSVVQSVPVGHAPTGIAVGFRGVWVVNSEDGTLSRIDPATNSVSAAIHVGAKPSAVAVASEALWVASSGDGTVARIDPGTPRITRLVAVGSSPSALTVAQGKLWAATLPPLTGHRGGVLRVESGPSQCRCVDPVSALGPDFINASVSSLLYDGLVAYRRVGGLGGASLVSNLAVRLPTPTDDGRTYRFQLRPGIRYSDGTPVRASDFRSSLSRDVALNPVTALRGIAGVEKCLAGPRKPCDLSKGIEVDDGARTITIHLTRPDTEFLYKLALPEASVVPSSTPLRVPHARRISGTGPYRIASFDPTHEIRLVRNERFRVWSTDARPDGYPDEIRFQPLENGEAALAAVEKQTADWVSLVDASLAPERQRGVLTRYADRLHDDPSSLVFWYFLNTRVPPFDNVRARRALNYAIDRKRLVELTGGLVTTTCQLIPPTFPGYRPYCPYTRHPNPAGTWTAPNLAKARTLVAASGTAGMRVEVASPKDPPGVLTVSNYAVSVLRQLGYRSSLRVLTGGQRLDKYAADSRNRVQLAPTGWQADTLAASNFLQPIFACAAFVPKSPENLNLFEYCDPALDAKMKKAEMLQASDPVRADELWADIDHDLVDKAVAVSWGTPSDRVLVSKRVGNYQSHLLLGTLFDQLWVK